jgi:hypothetical protein
MQHHGSGGRAVQMKETAILSLVDICARYPVNTCCRAMLVPAWNIFLQLRYSSWIHGRDGIFVGIHSPHQRGHEE